MVGQHELDEHHNFGLLVQMKQTLGQIFFVFGKIKTDMFHIELSWNITFYPK